MAGVETLVFHAFNREGKHLLDDAVRAWTEFRGKELPTAEVMDRVTAMKFKWGEGDGN
jgi:hypothetical protein